MPHDDNTTRAGIDREVTVLSVSPPGDCISLARILDEFDSIAHMHSKWTLLASPNPESAVTVLRERRGPLIPIVVCECGLSPDLWKELLQKLATLSDPPYLIVTSRLANERLWAEALDLGAYDVLASPLDKEEVIRTLHSAWLHWSNRHARRASLAMTG